MAPKGIDQVKLGTRAERGEQKQSRGTLIDAYLDDPTRALRGAEQYPCILRRVHRAGWDQTEADGDRSQVDIVAQALRRQRSKR